jgi:predicted dehydrogenase
MSAARRVYRVALVGCGRISHVHCGYLKRLPHVEVVGACDTSRDSRETFAARWQVPTYADFGELLSAAQPEVAHVVTPPSTHASLAIQLLEAGLHVLVEKPMALNVEEADAMLAAAQRADRWLTVDHNRWFDPVMHAARQLSDSGQLGKLVGVEVFAGAAPGEAVEAVPGAATHWSAGLPGGTLFNLAPHPTYLLRGFTGAVSELQVVASPDSHGRLRELRAVVKGENALGSLTLSLQASPFMNRLTLLGSAMTVDVNLNNMTLIVRRARQLPKLLGKVLPNVEEAAQLLRATVVNGMEFLRGRQRYYPGMGIHFRAFYEALANGQAPPVSAEEGREAVRLMEQIWRQAGTWQATAPRRVARA